MSFCVRILVLTAGLSAASAFSLTPQLSAGRSRALQTLPTAGMWAKEGRGSRLNLCGRSLNGRSVGLKGRRGSHGGFETLRMAVGDVIELDPTDIGAVQEALAAAIADGNQVLELELPTTDRFKDASLNQIYTANTLYARELVRMFTQPAELCMVFPDPSECKIALAEYGGQVPFSFSSLKEPNLQGAGVYYYMVMHPVFDVREYIQADEMFTNEIQPKGGFMMVFNGELFKLRSGGFGGYYPDIFFPKLAEVRKRLMPQMVSAYYFRIFRGPPVGALYRKYPGPWQVLKAVGPGQYEVLWEGDQQAPPAQNDVFQKLQASR